MIGGGKGSEVCMGFGWGDCSMPHDDHRQPAKRMQTLRQLSLHCRFTLVTVRVIDEPCLLLHHPVTSNTPCLSHFKHPSNKTQPAANAITKPWTRVLPTRTMQPFAPRLQATLPFQSLHCASTSHLLQSQAALKLVKPFGQRAALTWQQMAAHLFLRCICVS